MAKGAFLAVKRGKLGDSIGYNVSNSNSREKQGWRIYQPVVANPQTDAQMVQRVKLAAVNNVYRALKEVIKRGFEGKAYGDPSRRAWLKLALGRDFTEGPWMPKGTQTPIPIRQVPITTGSLPPVSADPGLDWATNLRVLSGTPATMADLARVFIDNGYKEGDQVTIVQGYVPLRLSFAWVVSSFYLSLTDTRTISAAGLSVSTSEIDGMDYLVLQIYGYQVDALAIAVSRDGDGVYLRSTAYVATDPITVDAVWYGNDMYELAKRSYMNGVGAEDVNWPIQPTRGGGSTYTTTAADGTPVTLAGVDKTNGYYVVVNDAGEEYVVKCTDVQSVAYNAYLIAKTGSVLADVWTPTAPAGATADSTCNFNAGTSATGPELNLYYFLLSQGFDARALLARLPNA